MALNTYRDTLPYLKVLNLLPDLPKQPFFIVYDPEADVLYIDFQNPPQSAHDSELTENDIIIRYGPTDTIVGLTILNASHPRPH
ncbi:MAG: DUF2283 domain-containing protein [Prochlorothrix sp.]|nr:DUF2283 domain-containing protein [Prochlorothrix sp.]